MFLFAHLMESEWIEGTRNGDERAYRALFNHFYAPLAAFAAEQVGSYDAGREITQEVFIRIWQSRAEWRPSAGGLKTYMYRAVYNQCLNYIKKEKTRKKYEDRSVEGMNFTEVASDSTALERELMVMLNRAIERLPERRRMVFVLHRQHDMSVREVAEVLAISTKTVENQMGLALRDLREALKDYLK